MKSTISEKYGPWALITGGTSGIGAALAEELAQSGVNLLLAARNATKLGQQAQSLKRRHRVEVETISVDLSENDGFRELIDKTQNYDVGLFIPSAALENNGEFTQIEAKDELRLLQLNVISVYALTHHFAKRMQERKRGGILLVTSLSGIMPSPYFSNYAGSKAYVQNLGYSLNWEMRRYNIDVSVLAPGPTATPMLEGTGVDFSKTQMNIMSAKSVAQIALKGLGRKAVIVPGLKNRIMAFMLKYLISTKKAISMNGKMMEKVADFNK